MPADLGRVVVRSIGLPLLLTAALLAGCGDGQDVDCDLQQCTVTFQRGVEASVNVFGLEAELVEVQNGAVVLDIGGNRLTVPMTGDSEGVQVSEVTDDRVVVVIPHNIAG
jgi:hypothetical protein